MIVQPYALLALMLTVSCAAAAPPKDAKSTRMQFAFFHFKNERVLVTVDGKTVFDRAVPAASPNWPDGFTAVAQISLPPCANIVVKTRRQRIAQRLCVTAATKSIVIDGGPPITLVAKDQYQGED